MSSWFLVRFVSSEPWWELQARPSCERPDAKVTVKSGVYSVVVSWVYSPLTCDPCDRTHPCMHALSLWPPSPVHSAGHTPVACHWGFTGQLETSRGPCALRPSCSMSPPSHGSTQRSRKWGGPESRTGFLSGASLRGTKSYKPSADDGGSGPMYRACRMSGWQRLLGSASFIKEWWAIQISHCGSAG